MADSFEIEIVTPERLVLTDQALEMQVPGKGGYLGILPGHAPLISELTIGEIAYRTTAGKVRRLAVAWGFAEILPNKVTILAEIAERAEEIDVERARREKETVEAKIKSAPPEADVEALHGELQRVQNRLEVADKLTGDMANLVP